MRNHAILALDNTQETNAIRVNRKALLNALDTIKHVALHANDYGWSELKFYVGMYANGETLTIWSNMDQNVLMTQVEAAGELPALLILHDRLIEHVEAHESNEISILLQDHQGAYKLTISSEATDTYVEPVFMLDGSPLELQTPNAVLEVDAAEFKRLISVAKAACHNARGQHTYRIGVQLDARKGLLSARATNGTVALRAWTNADGAELSCNVMSRHLYAIEALIRSSHVRIWVDENIQALCVESAQNFATLPCISDQHPDYDAIVPKNLDVIENMPKKLVLNAIEAVMPPPSDGAMFALPAADKSNTQLITVKFKEQKLSLYADTSDGRKAKSVKLPFDTPTITFTCDAVSLLAALNHIRDEYFTLAYGNDLVHLTGKNCDALVAATSKKYRRT